MIHNELILHTQLSFISIKLDHTEPAAGIDFHLSNWDVLWDEKKISKRFPQTRATLPKKGPDARMRWKAVRERIGTKSNMK